MPPPPGVALLHLVSILIEPSKMVLATDLWLLRHFMAIVFP